MNVTKHVLKGRQLHKEGYPRMAPAEQGEYLFDWVLRHEDILTILQCKTFMRKRIDWSE